MFSHITVCFATLSTTPSKSDFILQVILLHTRLYRYDAHDTILLNHIHFGSLLVMRRKNIIKKNISKFSYSYVIVLYIVLLYMVVYVYK